MNKLLILLLIFTSQLCWSQQSHIVMSEARADNQINHNFPFDISLIDQKDKMFNTAELFKKRKKPLVVLFWLTTCGPCRMELQAINSKIKDWQKNSDFDLVAISTDFTENHEKFIKRVEEEKWAFPAYRDHRREFSFVLPGGLNGLPQLFIFDKKGEIVYQKRRYIPGDEDAIIAKIKEM